MAKTKSSSKDPKKETGNAKKAKTDPRFYELKCQCLNCGMKFKHLVKKGIEVEEFGIEANPYLVINRLLGGGENKIACFYCLTTRVRKDIVI